MKTEEDYFIGSIHEYEYFRDNVRTIDKVMLVDELEKYKGRMTGRFYYPKYKYIVPIAVNNKTWDFTWNSSKKYKKEMLDEKSRTSI